MDKGLHFVLQSNYNFWKDVTALSQLTAHGATLQYSFGAAQAGAELTADAVATIRGAICSS